MKFELFVGLKYLKAKRKNSFISIITIISIIGVMVGVMALITVTSVMNGFQINIRDKIINSGFHIYITKYDQSSLISGYRRIVKKVKSRVKYAEPFYKAQAIIKSKEDRIMGIDLQGLEPGIYERDKTLKKSFVILAGKFDLKNKNNILLGSELAKFLGVTIGEEVVIIASRGEAFKFGGSVIPAYHRYRVRGIFKIGYYEYDLKMAIVSLKSLQELTGEAGKAWGIGIKIDNIYAAPKVALTIKRLLEYRYQIFTWMDLNHNLFKALKNEKTVLTFIVFLIIMVAAFNIASTLIMVVLEKKKDIGIFRSMGCTKRQIENIFLLEGVVTGLFGTILGLVLGLLTSYNLEKIFRFIENLVNFLIDIFYSTAGRIFGLGRPMPFSILAKDVYYFDSLPVIVKPLDVILICSGAMLVSIIFSLFPAKQASKLNPVEAIRYE